MGQALPQYQGRWGGLSCVTALERGEGCGPRSRSSSTFTTLRACVAWVSVARISTLGVRAREYSLHAHLKGPSLSGGAEAGARVSGTVGKLQQGPRRALACMVRTGSGCKLAPSNRRPWKSTASRLQHSESTALEARPEAG